MTAAQPSPSTRSPRLSPNSAFALRPLRLSVILRPRICHSSLNSRPFNLLRTLCRRQKDQLLCNQANPDSFAKTPGGYLSTSTPPFDSAVVCATWRLYPLCPHSIAHTSRHHGGVPPTPFRFLGVCGRHNWLALCFHILTNCFSHNSLVFTTIPIARGCGGCSDVAMDARLVWFFFAFHQLLVGGAAS